MASLKASAFERLNDYFNDKPFISELEYALDLNDDQDITAFKFKSIDSFDDLFRARFDVYVNSKFFDAVDLLVDEYGSVQYAQSTF